MKTLKVNPNMVLAAVHAVDPTARVVKDRPGARFLPEWDGPVNALVHQPRVAQAVITGKIPVTALVAYGHPVKVRSTEAVVKRVLPAIRKLSGMGIEVTGLNYIPAEAM
jgi:hypothetical protein